MSLIAVLKAKNAKPTPQERSHKKSSNQPISLLAFLQAENSKLRSSVSKLEIDIVTLRNAVQKMQKN